MFFAFIYIIFSINFSINAEKTHKVHLQAMSSAEVDNLEIHNQGRGLEPTHDNMFDDGKSTIKYFPLAQQEKSEASTTSSTSPLPITNNPLRGLLPHRPLPLPPSLLTDEERDLENMLNLKEIPFITDETASTTEKPSKNTPEGGVRKARQVREINNATLTKNKQNGRPLILKSTDDEEEADTAPPEVVDGSILIKGEEDFLKQLSQAKLLKSGGAHAHQGGNVKTFVDFEEALKVTVPYDSEKDSSKEN